MQGHDVRALTRRPDEYPRRRTPWRSAMTKMASLRRAPAGGVRRLLPGPARCTRTTSRRRTPRPRARSASRRPTRESARSSTSAGWGSTARRCPRTSAPGGRWSGCSAPTACRVTVLRAANVVGHGGISWEMDPPAGRHAAADGGAGLGPDQDPAHLAGRRRRLPGGGARPSGGDGSHVRDRRPGRADLRGHAAPGLAGDDRRGRCGRVGTPAEGPGS